MDEVKVKLGDRSYLAAISSGILAQTDFSLVEASRLVVITDKNVQKLYGDTILKQLKAQGLTADIIDIPAGEKSKTLETAGKISRQMLKLSADKNAVVLALGGGVVGDIAGFVAATYKRGIRYIQIPTTLMAQVDSSIGGKNGVNLPEGKNLIGTVYQPIGVLTDISFLKTLPKVELQNGLAEVIKYGVIADRKLFEFLEYAERVDREFYQHIITASCRIKAKIVEKDEYELDYRKILNYGHTIGHAIETVSGHKTPHGQSIAIGMAYEGKLAVQLGVMKPQDLKRQNRLLQRFGLAVSADLTPSKLIKVMHNDKKAKGKEIHFVLPTKIGKIKAETIIVSPADITKVLKS